MMRITRVGFFMTGQQAAIKAPARCSPSPWHLHAHGFLIKGGSLTHIGLACLTKHGGW